MICLEVLIIALFSFAAQATTFSGKQGRALPCGDSAQYIASAEAIVSGEGTPHFEMRKPGYVYYLAAMALLFGNMGWAATVGNHVCLALLPLAAYGFGRHLQGRALGILAALLTVARLNFVYLGDRVLSEPLFLVLLSFGLLVLVVGWSRERDWPWLISAGVLLGLSWLTRGSATPIIVAACIMLLIIHRQDWNLACIKCSLVAVPVIACILVECGLNYQYADAFRPSNGTFGATVLLRSRHFEGANLPDTPDTERVLSLVPERDTESAFVADHLDVWVARYRAIHDQGMNEWEYDDLMGRVGMGTLLAIMPDYLLSSVRLTTAHLLREEKGQRFSPVSSSRRAPPISHPLASSNINWDDEWYAFYGTPHLSAAESMSLASRMHQAAATKAPFGDNALWKKFRYWKSKPSAAWLINVLDKLGSLWPGLALMGCGLFGLNRRTCGFLALAYMLDALFIGFLTPTNLRMQFIWFTTDTVLAASLWPGCVMLALQYKQSRREKTFSLASVYRTRQINTEPSLPEDE